MDLDSFIEYESAGAMGIWQCAPHTGVLHWSDGFFRLLGLEGGRVDPSRARFEALLHPQDRAPWLMTSGRDGEALVRIRRPDGAMRLLLVRQWSRFTPDGRLDDIVGVAIDVSGHLRPPTAMTMCEVLACLIESIADVAVWRTDAHGNASGALGVSQGENVFVPGPRDRLGLVRAQDRKRIEDGWADAVARHDTLDISYSGRVGDHWRPQRTLAGPVMSGTGIMEGWIGITFAAEGLASRGEPFEPEMAQAAHIRGARALLGWSGEEMAERAKVSLSTVRRAESGTHDLGMETLQAIVSALEAGGVVFRCGADGRVMLSLA